MLSYATADLCDAFPAVQVSAPIWRDYGGLIRFAGPVMTLKVEDDNSLVRAELETPGQGRVLVVDAGGSLRCALVGGQLAYLGVQNGWAGVVLNGCVRDTAELGGQKLGVKRPEAGRQSALKSPAPQRKAGRRAAGCAVKSRWTQN